MQKKIINYCPKCGGMELDLETEPGQYSMSCRRCNFYCEIFVLDEGDAEGIS